MVPSRGKATSRLQNPSLVPPVNNQGMQAVWLCAFTKPGIFTGSFAAVNFGSCVYKASSLNRKPGYSAKSFETLPERR
jgi:hypothetical protein